MKKIISLFLCLLVIMSSVCVSASAITPDEWETYWNTDTEIEYGILMSPGSDESQRNFCWYSPADSGKCRVLIGTKENLSDAKTFYGTTVENIQKDTTNRVTVTNLQFDTTYYYKCVTDKTESTVRSFKTATKGSFSAIYVTDIHLSEESKRGKDTGGGTDIVKEQSYKLGQVYDAALSKNPDISLVLSGGDQASNGFREEYIGLTAPKSSFGMSFAPCFGNHDRKNVDYKYFVNNPNEDFSAKIRSYAASDYWYVYDNALFIVLDSNSANMKNHYNITKKAVEANPDIKWRVMIFHNDLYGNRKDGRTREAKLLDLMYGPIIDQFRIDLVMMGHSHYYSVSDVIFHNQSVQDTAKNSVLYNPAGSVYFVSGSINRPVVYKDNVPIGEHIGFTYLPRYTATIYNILDFTDDEIKISSYTLEKGDCFNTLTIRKSDRQGGHKQSGETPFKHLLYFIEAVYQFFENFSYYFTVKKFCDNITLWEYAFR